MVRRGRNERIVIGEIILERQSRELDLRACVKIARPQMLIPVPNPDQNIAARPWLSSSVENLDYRAVQRVGNTPRARSVPA